TLDYLGFNKVLNFDTDAIPYQNVLEYLDRFPDSDIIATTGTFPKNIHSKWGFTLCMGVLELRNSPNMKYFWDELANMTRNKARIDDQVLINHILNKHNITWEFPPQESNLVMNENPKLLINGTTLHGYTVTALSAEKFCRKTCTRDTSHVIVHHPWPRQNIDKRLLKTSWETIVSKTSLKSIEVLRAISNI
ncbi:unnamed protein product, partial [Owenia fusiformis]